MMMNDVCLGQHPEGSTWSFRKELLPLTTDRRDADDPDRTIHVAMWQSVGNDIQHIAIDGQYSYLVSQRGLLTGKVTDISLDAATERAIALADMKDLQVVDASGRRLGRASDCQDRPPVGPRYLV